MIKVDRLVYEYPGKRALKDVSFEIPEGSITALVGPNGAGKTTLLRCIAALDEPFSGSIQVAGVDVGAEPRRVHQVLGYLSDFFGLYDNLTVEQSLKFAAWLHKWPSEKVVEQVTATAEIIGLTPWLSKKAGTLSRGWRQRLGIAQAMIHRPRLLLLDEPASGLDPEARVELSTLFRRLRQEGMTLVISSHILAELEDYCTDMLILRDGEIVSHQTAVPKEDAVAVHIAFVRDMEKYKTLLQAMPEISNLGGEREELRFHLNGGEDKQQALLRKLLEAGAAIKAFKIGAERLQDIYLSFAPGKDKN